MCAVLLTLILVATDSAPSGEEAKRRAAVRQGFLEMFARAYFPGRSGQILIVPREGDFITRPDSDVTYMHGSPWPYDVGSCPSSSPASPGPASSS